MSETNLANWLNWLAAQRKAPATIRAYTDELRYLAAWCGPRGLALEAATTADLLAYVASRAHLSGAALKRAVSAMRSFYGFLRPAASPAAAIPWPRVKRRHRRTLRADDVLKLLAACESTSPRGVRDLALVSLLYETGLRAAEVCRLRLADVELAAGQLVVQVKGGDDSVVYFGQACARQLQAWLEVRATLAAPDCVTLFCGAHLAESRAGRALTTGGLRAIMRAIGRRAGQPGLAPHDLRRAFAAALNRAQAPHRTAMAAGRWTSEAVYHGYIREVEPDVIRPYLPLDRLLS